MRKILHFFGFHKRGNIINESVINVWGDVSRLWECSICKEWNIEIIDAKTYCANLHWGIWKHIHRDLLK